MPARDLERAVGRVSVDHDDLARRLGLDRGEAFLEHRLRVPHRDDDRDVVHADPTERRSWPLQKPAAAAARPATIAAARRNPDRSRKVRAPSKAEQKPLVRARAV